MSRVNPSVLLVVTVSIMALRATYFVAKWLTTLTQLSLSLVGKVFVMGMRMTLLVAMEAG